jgi:NAD(P)-dependent dehydrogenase (short-subunit alcohol dehydrogenase family)
MDELSTTNRPRRLASRVGDAIDALADLLVVPGYSRVGYAARRRLWAGDRPRRLDRKHVLVTGASSGIGEAICCQLAGAGATVHMAVRDPGRGQEARQRVAARQEGDPAGQLLVERCDVSDLEDVSRYAEELRSSVAELHGVVHNAGVLTHTRERSRQGHELTFATAVLGPFALTRGLAAPLCAAAPSRVVFVSSGGMYTAELESGDIELDGRDFDGPRFYAHAKRAQVVLASLFAKRWSGANVAFASCHPGWADTPGLAASLPRFRRFMRPILRDAAAGADTASWLVAGDEIEVHPGAFWHDRRVRPKYLLPWTRPEPEDAERVWAKLTRIAPQPPSARPQITREG